MDKITLSQAIEELHNEIQTNVLSKQTSEKIDWTNVKAIIAAL